MTYSIVAVDLDRGQIGVAVQSHFFGVGSLVPWARAGVGAVATQSIVEPSYGEFGLDRMSNGDEPATVLSNLIAADPSAGRRQVAIMDVRGRGSTHTGSECIGAAGHSIGEHSRAQANLVVGPAVWESMTRTFEESSGDLAQRLLAALRAAQDAGGDLRGQQAAAIKVVRTDATGDLTRDVLTDLRVDDSACPLEDLGRLLAASTAMAGLLAMLTTDGLLTGPFHADPPAVTAACAELARAQDILGPGNSEPTVWRGLLLARAGQDAAAAAAFRQATDSNPLVPDLVRRLAGAGMWVRSRAELEVMLEPGRI